MNTPVKPQEENLADLQAFGQSANCHEKAGIVKFRSTLLLEKIFERYMVETMRALYLVDYPTTAVCSYVNAAPLQYRLDVE